MTLQERIDRIQKSIDAAYEDIKWVKEHSASAGHCKKYQINTDQLIANEERIIAMYGQINKGLKERLE